MHTSLLKYKLTLKLSIIFFIFIDYHEFGSQYIFTRFTTHTLGLEYQRCNLSFIIKAAQLFIPII